MPALVMVLSGEVVSLCPLPWAGEMLSIRALPGADLTWISTGIPRVSGKFPHFS